MFVSQNHLLRGLPAEDLEALAPDLSAAALSAGRVLETPGFPATRVYFPETGVVSVIAEAPLDQRIGIGLVGHEGMTGLSLVLGAERSAHQAQVQIAGAGHWIGSEPLQAAMQARPAIRRQFLLYAQAFAVQAGQTALANGVGNIEQRLARWLLMADDRARLPMLPLTHEFLASVLSVRRAGVTDAMHKLEGALLIRAARGRVMIRDRAGLEALADGLYGIAEAHYARLLGSPGSPPGAGAMGTAPDGVCLTRAETGKPSDPTGGSRVLIIDDSAQDAYDLEQALLDAGWEVCGVAASKLLAFAIAEGARPEFAVVDIELSSGDGRFVAQELVRRYGTAVLFTSVQPADLRRLERHGGLGFIAKPYHPREVIAGLAEIREVAALRKQGPPRIRSLASGTGQDP